MDAALLQSTLAYGSLVVVLLLLSFAMWSAVEGRSSDRSLTFAGVVASVSLWLLAFAFWRIPTLSSQSMFWFRSLYFFGSLIPAFYYLFSLTYLFKRRLPKLVWPVVLVPNVVIAWFVYADGNMANFFRFSFTLLGGGRTLFAIHFSLFVIASLLVLFYASRVKQNIDPKEIFPVIAGAIISFYSVFGVLFSSFMAQNVSYLMTVASLVGGIVIIVPFIIQRRLLVDLRLVGAEILILLALFVFLADIVASSESLFDFGFRLVVLVLLLFYGAMTTRVFVKEIKQLQRSEAMQEQIIRMNGKLIEADRLKTKFVSLVAHQLRSPLTSMHIYLNMARGGEFGKVPKKLDEVLKSNMEILEFLIQTSKTFLDVARIESGKIELFKAETDLGALVARLAKECSAPAAKRGLSVSTDIMSDLPPVVCDAGAIFHVLLNMVDNSLKYTEKGGLVLRASSDGEWAEVTVTDTGMGMTEEDLQVLFRIFERGMSAVKLESKGEGLGMFIAKQFIDAHGGKMIAESAGRDRGSTFGFRIPVNG